MSIEKFESNGFVYIKNYDNREKVIQIEHSKPKPKYLYKYFSSSKYNTEALLKSYLYSSHPTDLNDILDSSFFFLYTSKPFSIEQYKKFFSPAFRGSQEKLFELYRNDLENPHLCGRFILEMWKQLSNLIGIISTSEKENNNLMWPHYTQEQGFQLKWNTEKLEESIVNNLDDGQEYLGVFPLNYVSNIEPIDVNLFREWFIPLFYSLTTKSTEWHYENEWRFIISKPQMGVPMSKMSFSLEDDYIVSPENRFTQYSADSIEEITLGKRFFNGKDFQTQFKNPNEIIITLKKSGENVNNKAKILDYIAENLSDKLYCSGIKYETNNDKRPFLIRTKEQTHLKKLDKVRYKLIRTENVIKFVNEPA